MYKLIYRFIFIFLFTAIQDTTAQHFEWASSGSNILTGYSKSCVTSDGRLIAAGQYQTPSYRISDGDPVIYSGSGEESSPEKGLQKTYDKNIIILKNELARN